MCVCKTGVPENASGLWKTRFESHRLNLQWCWFCKPKCLPQLKCQMDWMDGRESSPGHHPQMVEMLIISEVRGVRHLYVAVLFVCASGLMTGCWCCWGHWGFMQPSVFVAVEKRWSDKFACLQALEDLKTPITGLVFQTFDFHSWLQSGSSR